MINPAFSASAYERYRQQRQEGLNRTLRQLALSSVIRSELPMAPPEWTYDIAGPLMREQPEEQVRELVNVQQTLPREYDELLGQADYFGIANPERMPADQLLGLVQERFRESREYFERNPQSAAAFRDNLFYLQGSAGLDTFLETAQRIPFVGDLIHDMQATRAAERWLSRYQTGLAARVGETPANIAKGIGTVASYAVPATAAWKFVAAAGMLPEVAAGSRLSGLVRGALQGGFSEWLIQGGGDAPIPERALNIALGAAGGAGAAAGGTFGAAVAGGGVGAIAGNVASGGDPRATAGGALLGALGAAGYMRRAQRSFPSKALSIYQTRDGYRQYGEGFDYWTDTSPEGYISSGRTMLPPVGGGGTAPLQPPPPPPKLLPSGSPAVAVVNGQPVPIETGPLPSPKDAFLAEFDEIIKALDFLPQETAAGLYHAPITPQVQQTAALANAITYVPVGPGIIKVPEVAKNFQARVGPPGAVAPIYNLQIAGPLPQSQVQDTYYHGGVQSYENIDLTKAGKNDSGAEYSLYGPAYYSTKSSAVAGGSGDWWEFDRSPYSAWGAEGGGYAAAGGKINVDEAQAYQLKLQDNVRRAEARDPTLIDELGYKAPTGMDWFDYWTPVIRDNAQWSIGVDGVIAPNVRPMRLLVRNPLRIDYELPLEQYDNILDELRKQFGDYAADEYENSFMNREFQEDTGYKFAPGANQGGNAYWALVDFLGARSSANRFLKSAGFDGIIHWGGRKSTPHEVVAVFDPSQVYSAFGPAGKAQMTGVKIYQATTARPPSAPQIAAARWVEGKLQKHPGAYEMEPGLVRVPAESFRTSGSAPVTDLYYRGPLSGTQAPVTYHGAKYGFPYWDMSKVGETDGSADAAFWGPGIYSSELTKTAVGTPSSWDEHVPGLPMSQQGPYETQGYAGGGGTPAIAYDVSRYEASQRLLALAQARDPRYYDPNNPDLKAAGVFVSSYFHPPQPGDPYSGAYSADEWWNTQVSDLKWNIETFESGIANGPTPNAWVMRLNIKNPFNGDEPITQEIADKFIQYLTAKKPADISKLGWEKQEDWNRYVTEINELVAAREQFSSGKDVWGKPYTSWDTKLGHQPGTTRQLYKIVANLLGKVKTTEALKEMGYDGIRHWGEPDGDGDGWVWIAFGPEQVYGAYGPEGFAAPTAIPVYGAAPRGVESAPVQFTAQMAHLEAVNLSKHASLVESPAMADLVTPERLDDADVAWALTESYPGQVGILRGLQDPEGTLQRILMEQAPNGVGPTDFRVVQRGEGFDLLVSGGVPITEKMQLQYEAYGMFEGQLAVHGLTGQEVVVKKLYGGAAQVQAPSGGPLADVLIGDLLPQKSSSLAWDVPDLYDEFMRFANGLLQMEAVATATKPLDFFGVEAGTQMVRLMNTYLKASGVDPQSHYGAAVRWSLEQKHIETLREFTPVEEQDFYAHVEAEYNATVAKYGTPQPTLYDLARARDMEWRPEERALVDLLSDGQLRIPVESEHAAKVFLENFQREAPDNAPPMPYPLEAVPQAVGYSPNSGAAFGEYHSTQQHEDALLTMLESYYAEADQKFGALGGGGGGAPPPPELPPAGGFGEPPKLLPGTSLTSQLGIAYKNDPRRYNDLRLAAASPVSDWLVPIRNIVIRLDEMFNNLGVTQGNFYSLVADLQNGYATHVNRSAPWKERAYAAIEPIRNKFVRDGTLWEILNAEDHVRETMMRVQGFNAAERQAVTQWDAVMSEFHSSEALQAFPEMGFRRHYISWMNKWESQLPGQTRNIPGEASWGPENPRGPEQSPELEKDVGVIIPRYFDGFFKLREMNGPYQELMERIRQIPEDGPEELSGVKRTLEGWAKARMWGLDPTHDKIANGVRWILDTLGKPLGLRVTLDDVMRGSYGLFAAGYRQALGGQLSPLIRDMPQLLMGGMQIGLDETARVMIQYIKDPQYRRMVTERGRELGTIQVGHMQGVDADVMGAGAWQTQQMQAAYGPEAAARREQLAQVGDFLQDRIVKPAGWHGGLQGKWYDPLFVYSKLGDFARLILGEVGYQQAMRGIGEFGQVWTNAGGEARLALRQQLLNRSRVGRFQGAIQRSFMDRVEAGDFEGAAKFFANEVANSQNIYGLAAQPPAWRQMGPLTGRIGMRWKTFTTQTLANLAQVFRDPNISLPNKMAFGSQIGVMQMLFAGATALTGWNFHRMGLYGSIAGTFQTSLFDLTNDIQRWGGWAQTATGSMPSPDVRALMGAGNAGTGSAFFTTDPTRATWNPWGGAIRTATGFAQAAQWGPEAIARFAVTGQRSDPWMDRVNMGITPMPNGQDGPYAAPFAAPTGDGEMDWLRAYMREPDRSYGVDPASGGAGAM